MAEPSGRIFAVAERRLVISKPDGQATRVRVSFGGVARTDYLERSWTRNTGDRAFVVVVERVYSLELDWTSKTTRVVDSRFCCGKSLLLRKRVDKQYEGWGGAVLLVFVAGKGWIASNAIG